MRQPHLEPRLVLLVAAGGAVGSGARYLLAQAVPVRDGWPYATLGANVLGAFLLGLLLETLVHRGPETRRARDVRLAAGTGALGGLTTFSGLALEVERLLAAGSVGTAAAYAITSVVLGVVVCLAGVRIASRRATRRSGRVS
ncbi:fluoride efflux transporter FluC [Sanguibacter suaedae]|uniref:fluoride efflux transporter FluC n=1 Tax=Sanguibacter suaedae TaxID=2795737 RepID=UPI0027DD9E9D|nr:CrcB family protein [Sanguibacter suaedae]